jgi:hypothetical protein
VAGLPPTPLAAAAYSLTRPSQTPSGLAYTEHVLATLLDRGLKPATAFSIHLILFNYISRSPPDCRR